MNTSAFWCHVFTDLKGIHFLTHFSQSIACLQSDYSVICSDLNSPDILWSKTGVLLSAFPLVDWAMDNFSVQHVTSPTRSDSRSILDLVFSSVVTQISNLSVDERLGSSDHSIVIFYVTLPCTVPIYKSHVRSIVDCVSILWSHYCKN